MFLQKVADLLKYYVRHLVWLFCCGSPWQAHIVNNRKRNTIGLCDEGRAHYVMVSKIQWKPFWLATQPYLQNDWTGWQNGVNDDVCVHAPSSGLTVVEAVSNK